MTKAEMAETIQQMEMKLWDELNYTEKLHGENSKEANYCLGKWGVIRDLMDVLDIKALRTF